MKNTLRTIALSAALIASGAGLVQAAQAQSATDAAPAQAQPGGHPGWHHDWHRGGRPHGGRPHGAGPMGESPLFMLGHLKGKLNLTESQQKLWSDAQAKGKEVRDAMRAQRDSDRQALSAQIASAPLDLHAEIAREDAGRAALKPKFDAARDAWVAVYDSLDAKQKQTVTDAVKHSMARGDHMRERMRERMSRHMQKHQKQDAPAQAPAAN